MLYFLNISTEIDFEANNYPFHTIELNIIPIVVIFAVVVVVVVVKIKLMNVQSTRDKINSRRLTLFMSKR